MVLHAGTKVSSGSIETLLHLTCYSDYEEASNRGKEKRRKHKKKKRRDRSAAGSDDEGPSRKKHRRWGQLNTETLSSAPVCKCAARRLHCFHLQALKTGYGR